MSGWEGSAEVPFMAMDISKSGDLLTSHRRTKRPLEEQKL